MWKRFVPIVVGVAVGIATAIVAFSIMFSMAWSGIHSGRTDRPGGVEIALAYVGLLCAVAVPFVLGPLAARATHRAMGGKTGPRNSS
jgi:hypothetical protein